MPSSASGGYVEGPRHATITPDDNGPVVEIVAWFLLVLMISATGLRLSIRFTTAHVAGRDDAVLFAGMLTGVGEIISITIAAEHGFGRHEDYLNGADWAIVFKAIYAATILYLVTIALAKLLIALLLVRLAVLDWHQWALRAVGGIVIAITAASTFTMAFACRPHTLWIEPYGRCLQHPMVFWGIISGVDIITDLALVLLPARIVWDLQMGWSKKLIVASAFAFRLLLLPPQILRLTYLPISLIGPDASYTSFPYILATITHAALSVTIASIPALKPFMDRVQSGLLGVSLTAREGATYGLEKSGGSGESAAVASPPREQQIIAASQNSGLSSASRSGSGRGSEGKLVLRPDVRQDKHEVLVETPQVKTRREAREGDDGSQIERVVEFAIQYSDDCLVRHVRRPEGTSSSETSLTG